jgi:hypothetical protein
MKIIRSFKSPYLVLKSNLIKQLKGLPVVTLKNWINKLYIVKINFLFLERETMWCYSIGEK